MYYVCFGCVCVCISIHLSLFFPDHTRLTRLYELELRRRLSMCKCEYLCVSIFVCMREQRVRMYLLAQSICVNVPLQKERFSIFVHSLFYHSQCIHIYAVGRSMYVHRTLYLYSTAHRTDILYNMHCSSIAYAHIHTDTVRTHKTRLQYQPINQPASQPASQMDWCVDFRFSRIFQSFLSTKVLASFIVEFSPLSEYKRGEKCSHLAQEYRNDREHICDLCINLPKKAQIQIQHFSYLHDDK